VAVDLVVNGEKRSVVEVRTVDDLVGALGLPRERVAVELNGDLVIRAERASRTVKDGDRVEIVTLVGGG
jgi:sulfur carrier protein